MYFLFIFNYMVYIYLDLIVLLLFQYYTVQYFLNFKKILIKKNKWKSLKNLIGSRIKNQNIPILGFHILELKLLII